MFSAQMKVADIIRTLVFFSVLELYNRVDTCVLSPTALHAMQRAIEPPKF